MTLTDEQAQRCSLLLMQRRSLLQALVLAPLAGLFPFLRTARASCEQCGDVGPGCAQFHDIKEPRVEGLHVYVSEGDDIVVARSPRDAAAVFCEHTGPWTPDRGPQPSLYPESWVQWDDDEPFELSVEGRHDRRIFCHGTNGIWTVSASPFWWAARNGRGYLGSGGPA